MGINRENEYDPKLEVDLPSKMEADSHQHQAIVDILNVILADETVLSMKTRRALWNVRGTGFGERRKLYDFQFKQLNEISDQITKRVQVLGGQPLGSFEEFLKNSRLEENHESLPAMKDLFTDHEAIIRFLQEDGKKCGEVLKDEVTRNLLATILAEHDKMAQVLRPLIEPALTDNNSQISKKVVSTS